LARFGRIALKTLLWIIASVILLVLLVVILIQVPAVQNFAKNKAVTFLEGKIHTKVKIGHISIGFPKLIVLENVYFEDQHRDTLIAGDKLKVNISMLKLLHHQVEVNEINLEGITANIKRGKDSVFNFDYITKAFAGEQKKTPKPTDTAAAIKFSVDKIILDRIKIAYNDKITGNDVVFNLGHFDTRVKDFDIDKMKFTIPKITLSGFNAKIIQTAVPAAPVDTATKPLNITLNLGTIDISKINIVYRSGTMAANVNLGKLLVAMNKIDLKNQNIGIKSIDLDNTNVGITFAQPESVKKTIIKDIKKLDTLVRPAHSTKGWSASLDKVTFANDDIKFDNNAQKPIAKGLDFAHMHISSLNADADNIVYNPDIMSGKINSFSFNEKSGLVIKQFHTTFFYGPKNAYLKNLLVQTPQSIIQKDLQVSYPSITSLSTNLGALGINANLDGSRLSLKDVLLLAPTMATMPQFKRMPNALFRINGRVFGKVNDLHIPSLEISGLSNTHIKASANMRGLPNVKKAYFDLNIADFSTSSADIAKVVPAGMIPANISIPQNLNLKGTFKGGISNFNTKMGLRSSLGAIDLQAAMKNESSKSNASYTANIKVNSLNVGALTKQPQMAGLVTLSATIKGTGLEPKTANLQFSGNVASAYVKGYTYKNLTLSGTAHNGSYVAHAKMNDPNIHFMLDAKANMSKKYPSVNAILMVDSINFQKLNFSKDQLLVHGKIVANVPTADPNYLNANIKATDLLIVNKGERIKLDTVSLVSTATPDSSTLFLKAPMLTAHLAGKYKLPEIGNALDDVIDRYFNTAEAKATAKQKPQYSPENFAFDIHVVKTPLVAQFVPELKQLQPVSITGHFNSQTGDLLVNGAMPKVVYGTNTINNLKLAINAGNNKLNYNLSVDDAKVGSSIDLLYTTISGDAQNDKLNMSLQVRDAAKKERYRIAGVFGILPNEYEFSFLPNGLLFDYTEWAVGADNTLEFGSKGILAKNLSISNNNQVLSVNSNPQQLNAPLTVGFKNFRIETLTRIARQDSLQVGGVINGDANISSLQTSPVFTSALNINDFNFKGDTVGNVALKVNNQTANAYNASMIITGKGNQVNLDGTYYTQPNSHFDLNLDIVTLNMKGIEGFSFGSLRNASGNISGNLKISGTPSVPVVRGDINFNKVGFNVAMLNSYFTMPNERITFNNDGILFNNFTMVDSTGNKAVVTGTIYTKTFTDFGFAINIHMDNFRVVNSTHDNNKLFYGKLYVNSDISIKGNMNKPVVDATLTVNDKTDMTFVLPENDPSVQDREGVVEVINEQHPRMDSILMARQLDSLKKTGLRGLDVNSTINISKGASFTIVVDEASGDVVQIKGDGHLNGGIDPSGKVSLTGTYTVDQGSYNLAYATKKRKFAFQRGSTITWTGDPTMADINLTAIYVANVPPIDLVSQQLGGDAATNTMYKQKLPFNVKLNLRNQLLKPDISFDIVLPDNTYTVSPDVVQTVNTRLDQIRQDPNEMNKQVLGVLVLGHFIGDNPLQSQGGSTGINGAIRSSVSGLLSDQLNKLAGNIIGGIQLSFDLTSGADYSSGTQQNRTDLNVGLSKQFLNDRITVTVGNNFNLEGQNQPGQKTTDIAGNLSVNYRITADGRYLVRAYRRDEFIVVEGQVVETGVGFTITYEYNRFKELFKKKSKQEKELQKEYKRKEKEQKKEQQQADKEHDAQVPAVQPADVPAQQKKSSN
jgi:hypothetical protein